MKINEIKETVEQVVRTEYIAEDNTVFYSENECKKYEESALFAISKNLKRLSGNDTTNYDLVEFATDCELLEIFDVQTETDLQNLRRYLYLKLCQSKVREHDIKMCFSDEKRKEYVFDGVTAGHEVMVFWSEEQDYFWVYKDGSLNGYLDYIKERYNKIITKENTENENKEN